MLLDYEGLVYELNFFYSSFTDVYGNTAMNKVKTFPLDKNQKNLSELVDEYYSIAHWRLIDAIRIEIFHPRKSLKERKHTKNLRMLF